MTIRTSQTRMVAAAAALLAAMLLASACGDDGDDEGSKRSTAERTTTAAEQGPTLDSTRVESAITKELDDLPQLGVPTSVYPQGGGPPEPVTTGGGKLEIESVSCPEEIPLEEGGTFTCEMEGRISSGGELSSKGEYGGGVELTQKDSAGKRLEFKATLGETGADEGSGGAPLPVETTTEGEITLKGAK